MGSNSTRLDNGLVVVTERMPDVRSVALGFWVGTGSVDEAPILSGASHFLEHLLFKGTDTRSAREIAEAVDSVGGDMNAFTTKEYTTFYLRLLADDLELGLDILSDIIWSPSFRPDEVEAERLVILEEILMHGDEPAEVVHDVFADAMFPEHPLGREVLGDELTVRSLGRDAIAGFHAEHYQPANLVFAAAGALDHERVVAGVDARTNGARGGHAPCRRPPSRGAAARRLVRRATEQAHVIVGVRGPARGDEERHALTVIDHILGGGMSSRLFQSIREERGLAYSVYSYRLLFEGVGALAAYAGTSPANAGKVLDLLNEEMDRMASQGITQAELASAKSHLRGSLALGLEDSGARMSRIGHSQLIHGAVPTLDEVEARMTSLTVEVVNDLAARVLSGSRTTVLIGPFEGEDL